MHMTGGIDVWSRFVDGGMDDEAGSIDSMFRRRYRPPFFVNQHKITSLHQTKVDGVWILRVSQLGKSEIS